MITISTERRATEKRDTDQPDGCAPRQLPGAPEPEQKPSPRRAAEHATSHNRWALPIPGFGRLDLGTTEQLAFIGGVGVLAAFSLIDWPIAAVLAAGHILADQHRNKTLHAFGQALEDTTPK